jgi:glycosyltransferase involved in cell wall biosynthesis
VPAVLAAADAFVLCSKQEALGLSILEAMACELPAIGTRVGGMVETLEHGVSGWFSEPDPAAVADQLERILDDPSTSRRVGLAARARVLERFSLVESTRRHELLYLDRLP